MSTRKTTLFYSVLIAVASLAVGMVIASRLDLTPASSAQSMTLPPMNTAPLDGPIDASTFKNIAKAQIPTVVNIRTESRARTRELTEFFGGGEGDELFRRFFGGQPPPRRGVPPGRDDESQWTLGAGTGFVVDKSGLILTNNHVVDGADVIRVSLFGGGRTESYAAKIVGQDVLTDSALLQLTEMPAAPLQEVRFGDSSQMEPGDWVVAIGNPFNLSHTVTVGVISSLGRILPGSGVQGREQPMLQTDAAINPGNSGGPLLNIRGEVVGMNTAIYTDQRSANLGIGFATPMNTIRDLLPQLRAGKVVRGVVGVGLRPDPLTKEEAAAYGLPNASGALVTTVNEGEPAAKGGMQPGDIIVEYNGQPITENEQLIAMVVGTKPGTTVPVKVARLGEKQIRTLNVTVAELDLSAETGRASRSPEEPTEAGLGMTLAPITPEIARQLDLPRSRGGAIVSNVERRSPAANAGVQEGDVLLELNREPVTSPNQVTRVLQNVQPGAPVFMLVWRGGQEFFVTMTKR